MPKLTTMALGVAFAGAVAGYIVATGDGFTGLQAVVPGLLNGADWSMMFTELAGGIIQGIGEYGGMAVDAAKHYYGMG